MKALALLTAVAVTLFSAAASAQNLRSTVRQGQSSTAAGCYQRLGKQTEGTGHCAGPFSF